MELTPLFFIKMVICYFGAVVSGKSTTNSASCIEKYVSLIFIFEKRRYTGLIYWKLNSLPCKILRFNWIIQGIGCTAIPLQNTEWYNYWKQASSPGELKRHYLVVIIENIMPGSLLANLKVWAIWKQGTYKLNILQKRDR